MSKKQPTEPKEPLTVEGLDKFVFYDSYLQQISKVKDPVMRCQLYDNIALFGCRNITPDYSNDETGFIEAITENMIKAILRDKEVYVAKSNGGQHTKVNNPNGNNQHTTEPEELSPQDAQAFVIDFINDCMKDTKMINDFGERNGIPANTVKCIATQLFIDWLVENSFNDAPPFPLLTPQKIFTKAHLRNAVKKYIDREIETERKANRYASKSELLRQVVHHAPERTPQEIMKMIQHVYTSIQQAQAN